LDLGLPRRAASPQISRAERSRRRHADEGGKIGPSQIKGDNIFGRAVFQVHERETSTGSRFLSRGWTRREAGTRIFPPRLDDGERWRLAAAGADRGTWWIGPLPSTSMPAHRRLTNATSTGLSLGTLHDMWAHRRRAGSRWGSDQAASQPGEEIPGARAAGPSTPPRKHLVLVAARPIRTGPPTARSFASGDLVPEPARRGLVMRPRVERILLAYGHPARHRARSRAGAPSALIDDPIGHAEAEHSSKTARIQGR